VSNEAKHNEQGRRKKAIMFLPRKNALGMVIRNDKVQRRFSRLAECVRELCVKARR